MRMRNRGDVGVGFTARHAFRAGSTLVAALLVLTSLGPAEAAPPPGGNVSPALIGASNAGGVLLLHAEGEGNVAAGSTRPCEDASLASWDQAVTKVPGNGVPRLVIVYAAFPPESTAVVAAATFGIRYTSNVRVLSYGACNGGGLEIPNAEWPASGGGVSSVNRPFKKGNLFPLYWLSVACVGPGQLELTPNPASNMGGQFANDATIPQATPIADYGRLGFDLEGYLPVPGTPVKRGACCLDNCVALSEVECRFYSGIFLGDGTDCSNDPCGPYPLKSACCLPDGRCEMLSLFDCAKAGGETQGEGTDCAASPCVAAPEEQKGSR